MINSNKGNKKSRNKSVTKNLNKVSPGESVEPGSHTQGSTRRPVRASTSGPKGSAHQVQRTRAGRAHGTSFKSHQSCGKSHGRAEQSSGTQSTFLELEAVLSVKLNDKLLTFCNKPEFKYSNKKTSTNSQERQKSKKRNKPKPSGTKSNKTKGYPLPQTEKFLDRKQATYTPWTEEQKKNFAKLIEEYLV
jgi:hypothetical protein